MREVIAPERYTLKPGEISVFAAGSIEMGTATDWQEELKQKLSDEPDVVIFNPRRKAWDASWKQNLSEPRFVEQVSWEQDHVERGFSTSCNIVYINIDPATKSIISFGEFAQVFRSGWAVINCPQGYWRRGNIEVMCQRAGLRLHDNFEDSIVTLKNMIHIWRNAMSLRSSAVVHNHFS